MPYTIVYNNISANMSNTREFDTIEDIEEWLKQRMNNKMSLVVECVDYYEDVTDKFVVKVSCCQNCPHFRIEKLNYDGPNLKGFVCTHRPKCNLHNHESFVMWDHTYGVIPYCPLKTGKIYDKSVVFV